MATVLPVSYLAKTSSLKHEEMLVQNYQRSKRNFKTFGACYSTEMTPSYTFQSHTFLNFIIETDKYCG